MESVSRSDRDLEPRVGGGVQWEQLVAGMWVCPVPTGSGSSLRVNLAPEWDPFEL